MRRKIRIFSNIAIICLSVCMFAFGVYAANTVSVTTSGTVSFNATDVYATVTMGVNSTTKNTIANKSVTFEAGVAKETETWSDTDIQFKDDGSNIVMTFTVTNNATDRPLYVYMRDDSVATTKISKTIQYASSDYLGTEIEVSAEGSTTFIVTFTIADKNTSIKEADGVEYSLFINLSKDQDATMKNLSVGVYSDNTTLGTVSEISKDVANQRVILNAKMNANAEFLGWFEDNGPGERVGDLLTTALDVSSIRSTSYTAKFRTITKYYEYNPSTGENDIAVDAHIFNDDGTATFGNGSYSCSMYNNIEGDVFIVPAQISDSEGNIYTVTKIGDWIWGYSSNEFKYKKVIIGNTVEEIGNTFLGDTPNLEEVVLPKNLKVLHNSSKIFNSSNSNVVLNVELPEGFTTLGDYSFGYCLKLTVPSTLTNISSEWGFSIMDLYEITFNSGVLYENVLKLLITDGASDTLRKMVIKSEDVLNNIDKLCTLKRDPSNTYYEWNYGSSWNGDSLFTVKVLKSLEETTPNAYLNNAENGFTKTTEGEYNIYTKPMY